MSSLFVCNEVLGNWTHILILYAVNAANHRPSQCDNEKFIKKP